MLGGAWKSVGELEDNVSISELHRLFMIQQENDYNEKVFAASLKGVQMDPWTDPDDENQSRETDAERFDRIKREAAIRAAKANGEISENYVDPEASGLEGFGFMVE